MQGYDRDPRAIAKRAEEFLKPPVTVTLYSSARSRVLHLRSGQSSKSDMSGSMFKIFSSRQPGTAMATEGAQGNNGRRGGEGGYHRRTLPSNHDHEIRTAMCNALEEMGQVVEVHHHEVAPPPERNRRQVPHLVKADEVQTLEVLRTTSLTPTAGPLPSCRAEVVGGDSSSGMYVCTCPSPKMARTPSLVKAMPAYPIPPLYFIGGIIKHSKALKRLTNPSTNSYKRLVPASKHQ